MQEYLNRPSINEKYCIDCHVLLTEENTIPAVQKQHKNLCKDCRRTRYRYYIAKQNKPKKRIMTNLKGDKVKRCYQCKTIITEQNCNPSFLKESKYLCKKCNKEQQKQWIKKNPTYRLNWQRNYTVCGKNGYRHTKIKKRQRSDFCEICKTTEKKLSYHHWDDNHPEQGYWVCSRCHQVVEFIDKNGLEKTIESVKNYLETKKQIIKGGNSNAI